MASLQLSELSVGQPTASGEMMDLLMERNAEMVGQPELVPNLLDQLDSEFFSVALLHILKFSSRVFQESRNSRRTRKCRS